MSASWKYPNGRVVAFLDIGTNSLRLLLVRINPQHSYTVLSDQKEMIRLGEGEFVDQRLHPDAIQRAVLVARKFAEMARSYNAEEIIAVATSATREADNREEFLRRLKREARLDVHTISGPEEARLIYLGVSSGFHIANQQALFIDIGGGSTELILGNQKDYLFLDSLKLGSIRLTSLFFLPNEVEPVNQARYALLQQYVRNVAVRAVQELKSKTIDLVIGSSGTLENLADIAIYSEYRRRRQRDDVITYPQLKHTIDMLCSLSLEERRRVPGINPGRADIIVAGAAIIDTLMADLGLRELHITDRGLRDGLLMDYLSRSEQDQLLAGASVRERSIYQLGRACGFDEKHSQEVSRLALELFDSAFDLHLHKFGDKERELLHYTALVHDVGTFLSYSSHQQHSYYLIRNYDLLGFDQSEIAVMAAAALFHRKAMPSKKKHPEFAALDKPAQRIVRLFALLLRLAESLDRSHQGVVRHAYLCQGKPGEIILEVHSDQEIELELWGVQTHRQAFEKLFRQKMCLKHIQANKR
jgi:exopolyphosphatase/guanosine-5'-triphosphate,3'-diphosphate pyrophosphatase